MEYPIQVGEQPDRKRKMRKMTKSKMASILKVSSYAVAARNEQKEAAK
jgi:hypothetical protein